MLKDVLKETNENSPNLQWITCTSSSMHCCLHCSRCSGISAGNSRLPCCTHAVWQKVSVSDPGAEIPYIKYISTLGALRKETAVCSLSVWSYTETKLNSNKEIEFVLFLSIQINLIELICWKKIAKKCISICKFQPLKQQYVRSMSIVCMRDWIFWITLLFRIFAI